MLQVNGLSFLELGSLLMITIMLCNSTLNLLNLLWLSCSLISWRCVMLDLVMYRQWRRWWRWLLHLLDLNLLNFLWWCRCDSSRSCHFCALGTRDWRRCRRRFCYNHNASAIASRALGDRRYVFLFRRHFLNVCLAENQILVQFVDLELDVAIGRDEDLRWTNILSRGVVLNARIAPDELRSFAFCILLDVATARYAFVLVALLLRLLLLLLLDHYLFA